MLRLRFGLLLEAGLATLFFAMLFGCADRRNGVAPYSPEWHQKIAGIRSDEPRHEVEAFLRDVSELEDDGEWMRVEDHKVLYALDEDWKLEVEYTPEWKVKSYGMVGCGPLWSLRGEMPAESYADVELIHACPNPCACAIPVAPSPTSLIRAVNRLQQLGENKATEVLSVYCRLSRKYISRVNDFNFREQRICLIVLLLYGSDGGGQPMPSIGLGIPAMGGGYLVDHRDRSTWPLFPLVVSHDIPFVLVGGYEAAMAPPDSVAYLDACRGQGRFRTKPLVPSGSPLDAADCIVSSADWRSFFGVPGNEVAEQGTKAQVRWEALRTMVAEKGIDRQWLSDNGWGKQVSQKEPSRPHWDARRKRFVREGKGVR